MSHHETSTKPRAWVEHGTCLRASSRGVATTRQSFVDSGRGSAQAVADVFQMLLVFTSVTSIFTPQVARAGFLDVFLPPTRMKR